MQEKIEETVKKFYPRDHNDQIFTPTVRDLQQNAFIKGYKHALSTPKESLKGLEELRLEFDNFASDQFMSLDNIWKFFLPHLRVINPTQTIPTDNEIRDYAKNLYVSGSITIEVLAWLNSFEEGAKWVRDNYLTTATKDLWINVDKEAPPIGSDKQYPFASDMLLLSDGEFVYYGQYEKGIFIDSDGNEFSDDGIEIIKWQFTPKP